MDLFKSIQDTNENADLMVKEYKKILDAKQKTKESKIIEEENKIKKSLERVKKLESEEFDEDSDSFLIDALNNI